MFLALAGDEGRICSSSCYRLAEEHTSTCNTAAMGQVADAG